MVSSAGLVSRAAAAAAVQPLPQSGAGAGLGRAHSAHSAHSDRVEECGRKGATRRRISGAGEGGRSRPGISSGGRGLGREAGAARSPQHGGAGPEGSRRVEDPAARAVGQAVCPDPQGSAAKTGRQGRQQLRALRQQGSECQLCQPVPSLPRLSGVDDGLAGSGVRWQTARHGAAPPRAAQPLCPQRQEWTLALIEGVSLRVH